MAEEVLILDIGRDAVRAGVFTPRYEPAHFFVEPMEKAAPAGGPGTGQVKASLGTLLERLKAKRGAVPGRVLAGLPGTALSIRIVSLPFEDRKKITEALPFELGGMLHVDVEEMVIGAVPVNGVSGGAGNVLAVAVEKKVLREYMGIFAGLGIDPYWVGPATFSVVAALEELYGKEGTKAYIDPESLVVSDNGRLRFYKPVQTLEGVKLGLAYLDAEGIGIDEVYTRGWEAEDIRALVPLAQKVEELGGLPGPMPPEAAVVYGHSLILAKGEIPETINFRTGEFEYTREKLRQRRTLRYTAGFIALVVLLLGADAYIRYLRHATELEGYERTLKASYQQLFPGEKGAADPVYSMEAKLRSLEDEMAVLGGGPGVLAVLNSLAAAGQGPHKVTLTEVFIEQGRVTARGETSSFEGADYIKDAYGKDALFKEVRLSDVKAAPGGGAVFSLSITLDQ